MTSASNVTGVSRPTTAFAVFWALAANGTARRPATSLRKVLRLMSGRDAGVRMQQVDVATCAFGRACEDASARGQHADLVRDIEGARGILLDQHDGETFFAVE